MQAHTIHIGHLKAFEVDTIFHTVSKSVNEDITVTKLYSPLTQSYKLSGKHPLSNSPIWSSG